MRRVTELDPAATEQVERRGRRRQTIRLAVMAALVALFAVFAVVNRREVRVDWLAGHSTAPLFVVIVGTAVLGVVVGWLAHWNGVRRGNH